MTRLSDIGFQKKKSITCRFSYPKRKLKHMILVLNWSSEKWHIGLLQLTIKIIVKTWLNKKNQASKEDCTYSLEKEYVLSHTLCVNLVAYLLL